MAIFIFLPPPMFVMTWWVNMCATIWKKLVEGVSLDCEVWAN